MTIPMRHQVVEDSWERVRRAYGQSAGDDLSNVVLDLIMDRLGAICRHRGIPSLDFLPIFRRNAGPARLYIARDQHWSPGGHAAALRTTMIRLSGGGR